MPNPTATIYPPYHAIDDLIQRGTRAAQPAASAVTPGTLYGVTDEGNLVERSTGAVWQAYSPTGGGGAPAAHHVSHEPGGSDALANLSATTLTSGTLPDARLSANVPLLNAANQFTGVPQQIGPVATPRLSFYDAAPPVDARVFRIMDGSQLLQFDALNDAQSAVIASPLRLTRGGDAQVGQNLYEKGRATALGHWIDVPFNAADFAGTGGLTWTVTGGQVSTNAYTLIGKTLLWSVLIAASTLSGTPATALTQALPPGVTGARQVQINGQVNVAGGGWVPAFIIYAGGAAITIYRLDGTNFAVGALYLSFQIVLPLT